MDYDGARPTHNLSFNPTNHSSDSQREVPNTHTVKSPPRTGRSRLAVGQNRCRRGVSHKGLRRRHIGIRVPSKQSACVTGCKESQYGLGQQQQGNTERKAPCTHKPNSDCPRAGWHEKEFLPYLGDTDIIRAARVSVNCFFRFTGRKRQAWRGLRCVDDWKPSRYNRFMKYLTQLLDNPVVSPEGAMVGKIADAIATLGGRFPAVQAVILRTGAGELCVPYDALEINDPDGPTGSGQIVGDVRLRVPLDSITPYTPKDDDLRLRRDMLDKQIVDVQGHRVVRVSDVRLAECGNQYCVVGIDASLRATLRRLGSLSKPIEAAARLFHRPLRSN